MAFGNWHDKIGTTHENSSNREAPNKHIKGTKKYREMIDKDTKKADFWKNLPFTFSKPPKRTRPRRDIFHICDHCGDLTVVSKYTAGRECSGCKKYSSVNETNTFASEEELEAFFEKMAADHDE